MSRSGSLVVRLDELEREVLGSDVVVFVLGRRRAHEEHVVGELVPVYASVAIGVDLHEELLEFGAGERGVAVRRENVAEVRDELLELDAVVAVFVHRLVDAGGRG